MQPIKDYIASLFIDKKIHVKCDCLLPIDVTGIVVDYEIMSNEVILCILKNDKIVRIGLNTPSLHIEEVC